MEGPKQRGGNLGELERTHSGQGGKQLSSPGNCFPEAGGPVVLDTFTFLRLQKGSAHKQSAGTSTLV